MNANVLSESAPPDSATAEPRGLLAALVAAILLAIRRYLKRKAGAKPEPMSRADFLAAVLDIRERLHANHLALLEQLDRNHRELLTALERHGSRTSTLEAGFARLDERSRK
jgi:hypothetical protein